MHNTAEPHEMSGKSRVKYFGRILAVSLGLHFNAIIGMFFTPFLYRMILDFGLVEHRSEAGYFAGYVTGGYYLGRLVMSTFWGRVIDKSGRKVGLIVSVILTSILVIAFTWSPNFWLSVFFIFAVGLANGLTTICKTLSTEIVPPSLQYWSISITGSFWMIGNSIGPFIGSAFLDFIPSHPYLMSGIAVSSVGWLCLILALVFIRETLTEKEGYMEFDPDFTELADMSLDVSASFQPASSHQEKFFSYIKRKSVIPLLAINTVNLFCTTTLGDTLPLWLSAKTRNGGLHLGPDEIGHIFAVLGPFQLLIQVVLYPIIAKAKGDVWILRVFSTAMIPIYFILPLANSLFGHADPIWAKAYVSGLLGVRYLCLFVIFSSLQKIMNSSVRPELRGKLNGVAQTVASVVQIFGSYFGSVLIAWSMNNTLTYPFNHHFLFVLLACVNILSLVFFVYRIEPENDNFLDQLELGDLNEQIARKGSEMKTGAKKIGDATAPQSMDGRKNSVRD